jgi:hypothetical protein
LKDKQEQPNRVRHIGKDKRSRETTSLGDLIARSCLPMSVYRCV